MKLLYILVLLSLSILSGCGLTAIQKESVSNFAHATEGIGEYSANKLVEMRESTIKMNVMRIQLDLNKSLNDFITERKNIECGLIDDSEEQAICKGKVDSDSILYGEFSASNVALRISAATALSSYGVLLQSLVSDSQEEQIKSASDNFVSSLKSANNKVNGTIMDDQQLESIGIAIQAVGGLLVEYKKANAVKEIVLESKNAVYKLCDLLSKDFDRFGLNLAQSQSISIDLLKTSAASALQQKGNNLQDRISAMEAYNFAYVSNAKLNTVVLEIKNILENLKVANDQIIKSLTEDKSNKIDFNQISNLTVQFRKLNNVIRLFNY